MVLISNLASKVAAWFYNMRRRFATGAVAALACLLAYHVVFGANGMLVYQHKRAEYHALEKQVRGLNEDSQRVEQQIKALRSDPRAIEKEAREQLRYARPGEKVFLLPGPSAPPTPINSAANR